MPNGSSGAAKPAAAPSSAAKSEAILDGKLVLPQKGRTPQEQFIHEVKKCVDKALEKYAAKKSDKERGYLRRLVVDKVKAKEHGNTRFHIEETPRKIFKLVAHYAEKYKNAPVPH